MGFLRRSSSVLLAIPLLGMAGEPYRFTRAIEAQPGWNALELPDEVLAEARPLLADVRITGPQGEVAYAWQEALASAREVLPLRNVEVEPNRQTTAWIDRGEAPAAAAALDLQIAGAAPFLKPLTLEASDDRQVFRQIASGSIFRTGGVSMTQLRFAANDRRYLRIRLDDTQSEAVGLLGATLEPWQPPAAELREVFVKLEPGEATADRVSYVARLPHSNTPAVGLRFEVADPAFSRELRVYEKWVFRERLQRRLLAQGRIERAARGAGSLELELAPFGGSVLEVELENAGAALRVTGVWLKIVPKRLIFFSERGDGLRLLYGSPTAVAPSYDVARALAAGPPSELMQARLAVPVDSGAAPIASGGRRGTSVNIGEWQRRWPIALPERGTLAYLDVSTPSVDELRIVDAAGQQVPYLVEAEPVERERQLPVTPTSEAGQTTVRWRLESDERPLGLTLRATAPEYFSRSVQLFELMTDRRGPTGRRLLGGAGWERRPGDAAELYLSLEPVLEQGAELELRIDDGENPPLVLSEARLRKGLWRVNFLFESGEELLLLTGNPRARKPSYDISLLAPRLLQAPALRATLLPPLAVAPPDDANKRWFLWVAVPALAALLLLLARTLRSASVES